MQSYNLMKMSSQITKTQVIPTFSEQERVNNYYPQSQGQSQIQQPQIQPQVQQPFPQQQVDFNMYAQQRNNLQRNQVNEQNIDSEFLGKNLNILNYN